MASRASKSFSIRNEDAFARQIRALEAQTSESALRQAGAAGISVFHREVLARTPRDTGDLVAGCSVVYDVEESVEGKVAAYKIVWIGNTEVRYKTRRFVSRRALAGWLENGTSKLAPRPFVRSAFTAVSSNAVKAAQDKLREVAANPSQAKTT